MNRNTTKTDQTTWSNYQEAIAAFKNCENESIKGIGFVLIGTNFTGVDVDHCRDPETGIYDTNRFFTVSGNSPPGYGEPEGVPISEEDFSSLFRKSLLSDTKVFNQVLKQTKQSLSVFKIMGKDYAPPRGPPHNLRQIWVYDQSWLSGPKGPCAINVTRRIPEWLKGAENNGNETEKIE